MQVPEIHPWMVKENFYNCAPGHYAALLFQGNGNIGIPAVLEEDFEFRLGPYCNGFYELAKLNYPENFYGSTRNGQVLIDLPDITGIELYVNGERFSPSTGTLQHHTRILDFKTGILTRTIHWTSENGNYIEISIKRAVLHNYRGRIAWSYEVCAPREDCELTFSTQLFIPASKTSENLDPRLPHTLSEQIFEPLEEIIRSRQLLYSFKTIKSNLYVSCGATHYIHTKNADWQYKDLALTGTCFAEAGKKTILEKHVVYEYSNEEHHADLVKLVRKELSESAQKGVQPLLEEQREYVERFWQLAGIELEGEPAIIQGLRFSLFSLLQSTPRFGIRSISAKGLSSNKYDGHYFWDAEVYSMPFFLYTAPEIARNLLHFRYAQLDNARAHAQHLAFKGALYPWRTINGDEASSYFLAGTAQYHINADIAYMIKQYFLVTKDWDFILREGAEILFETARFWAGVTSYIPEKGYCIAAVTGPDEYTALVDNNYFTNVMAREHLRFASEVAAQMEAEFTKEFLAVSNNINLDKKEINNWQHIAEEMYLPVSKEYGMHAQDDSFLSRARWNFEETPPEHYPLLLNFHPLVIYRQQVLKQPDVVLANVFLPDDSPLAVQRRNFRYYDPITTGDSSLSPFIRSIAAARLGDMDYAWEYFFESARMDLSNLNGNTDHGVHLAAMGGTWMALVLGFGGVRVEEKLVQFSPRLPKDLSFLQFAVRIHSSHIKVAITHEKTTYTLLEGPRIKIKHHNTIHTLTNQRPKKVCKRHPELAAVLFDLDGVLTSTSEQHYLAWKKICDEYDISFNRTVNEELRGVGRAQSLETILKHAQKRISDEQFTEIITKKNDAYVASLQSLSEKDIFPHTVDLIDKLKRAGLAVAVVSASRNAPIVLRQTGLYDVFDYIADPEQAYFGKPDPELFLNTAEALKLVPRSCIGVEDSAAGIHSIKKAMMLAVGIGPAAQNAHTQVNSIADLTLAMLQEEFQKFAEKDESVSLDIVRLRNKNNP